MVFPCAPGVGGSDTRSIILASGGGMNGSNMSSDNGVKGGVMGEQGFVFSHASVSRTDTRMSEETTYAPSSQHVPEI